MFPWKIQLTQKAGSPPASFDKGDQDADCKNRHPIGDQHGAQAQQGRQPAGKRTSQMLRRTGCRLAHQHLIHRESHHAVHRKNDPLIGTHPQQPGNYDQVKVPVYLHCAWSPLGRWSAPIFTAMNDERLNVPKRLGVLEGYDGLELPYRALNEECLRWYDHWLKGVDTGIMDEPLYKFTVLNSGVRYENEWPLARTEWKKLYLRSFGRLRWDREPDSDLPPDGFTHLPPSVSTEVNKLVYKTSRFPQAKEISGPIELHLWASIDAEDANFLVKLCDVLPDGTRMPLIRYGALRASHPLDEEKSQIGRPVHDNTVSVPVTPGEIREYVIEINPTSIVIPAGHWLELEITSQCPNECHTEAWTGKVGNMNVIPSSTTTGYKIYRDNNHPSYVLLPLVPYTPAENWVQPFSDTDEIEVED